MPWSELLWSHVWWQYDPNGSIHDLIWQHGFNVLEGICWEIFAVAVLVRFGRFRKSVRHEFAYAMAFALFGVSDFIQAYRLTSWLLIWKLINLIVLLRLRSVVIRQHYPECKLF